MEGPAIKLIGKKRCTGCFGCYNVCPNEAIQMKDDHTGFYFPFIENNKCKNCEVCLNICPVYNKKFPNVNLSKPKVYAGWSKNLEIRYESSSGGLFYEIANYVLKNNGVIYGVAWDSDHSVKHIRITNNEDLYKIMGSKYLQSNVGMCYKKVIQDLSDNKFVLFSGTPCQVAALQKYQEKYSNLILVEVICHGVPSKLLFEKYLKSKFNNFEIKRIEFRNKKYSWRDFNIKISFKNKKNYIKHHLIDDFFFGFLQNYFLNAACYECNFATLPRCADISLGDFWTPDGKYDNKKLGVSLILTNTEKGEYMIQKISNIILIEEKLSYAKKANPRIANARLIRPRIRDKLIKDMKTHDFKEILKRYYLRSLRNQKIFFYFYFYFLRFIPKMFRTKIFQFLKSIKNL